MVEVLEYTLVILASTVVVAFSFGVYANYVSTIDTSTNEAAYSAVVTLAHAAVEHGNATASLALQDATIGCESGNLSYTSPWYSSNSLLPVDCSFHSGELSGLRRLSFAYTDGRLALQVR